MSRGRSINILCDECNREFEIFVYDSINADLDPELREKFIFDELYLFKCPYCGKVHFKPYPILYHDMTHKFMVQSGTLLDVYKFSSMDFSLSDMFNDIISKNDYIFTGATSTTLAREKVVALENGLNHKLATIYRTIISSQYNTYAEENDEPASINSYLCYDDDGNLAVILERYDEMSNRHDCICQKFNRDLYHQVELKYKEKLDGTCDYLFDAASAIRLLNMKEKSFAIRNFFKVDCALIEDTAGNYFFATIPSYLKNKLSKDDVVTTFNNDFWPNKGIIHGVENYTLYGLPFDYSASPTVMRTIKEDPETSSDSNEKLDNDDLLISLKKINENSIQLPFDLLRESEVIIGFTSTMSLPLSYINSNGDIELNDFLKENVDEFVKANVCNKLVTTNYKGSKLLNVYLDQDSVPSDNDDSPISKLIYNFDDVVTIIIQSPQFAGVIINPDKEGIIIPSNYFVEKYLPDRVLTNDKRTVKLLDSLSDSEISYIGIDNYKYICMIYFDNKNPSMISEELNVPLEKIGKAISDGYSKLKELLRSK